MPQNRRDLPPISGYVTPEFESVRAEFERNFRERGEQGAACAIYHRGRKVVDLIGGYRCARTKSRWDEQTLTLVFSVTKGMAAAAMAVAHSRGLFDLDDPVADYWPEFAQGGKERITIRQLLEHQAGLISIDERINARRLADHDALGDLLARQSPCWEPGTRHGYHTLTLGWYQSEIIRRTDPKNRSLGAFFQEEIAQPLEIEFYIGLPADIDEQRLSKIQGFHRVAMIAHLGELPPAMVLAGIWPRSLVSRSVGFLPISNPAKVGDAEYRRVEIPSANGFGQARAIAKVYDVLARGGSELGITTATWRELIAPAIAPPAGTYDAILKIETKYGFGFSRPSGGFQFGSDPHAFGCPGAGGCFGMADPSHELGYSFLTNRMAFRIFDDPREKAVREACYASLQAMHGRRLAA